MKLVNKKFTKTYTLELTEEEFNTIYVTIGDVSETKLEKLSKDYPDLPILNNDSEEIHTFFNELKVYRETSPLKY